MLKSIKSYATECARKAFAGSLSSASHLAGILGAGALGAFLQYEGVEMIFPAGWLGVVVSGIVYTVVAWIVLFLVRFLFVAPFLLWKTQRATIVALKDDKEAHATKIRAIAARETHNREMQLQREQRQREIDPQHRAYHDSLYEKLRKGEPVEDETLTHAIFWIASRSAWGKWRDAKSLRDKIEKKFAEPMKMNDAIRLLQTEAQEGKIAIRGWLPEQKALELIPIDTLRNTAVLDVQKDEAFTSIWRVSLRGRNVGDKLHDVRNYSYLLTDMRRVRELWPEADSEIDAQTRKLIAEASNGKCADPGLT